MAYQYIDEQAIRSYCEAVFEQCGFSTQDSQDITDVLLTADLYGIESHGVQRLIRYYQAIQEGSIIADAPWETVFETPLSKVIDAPRSMGQIMAKLGMNTAIEKAKQHGVGLVTVRGTNHFGIAGYYTQMAAQADMLGICMTNTEAIAVPTFGRKALLGTNPLAVSMPADPIDFLFDVSTTVVTRGKIEVYNKNEKPLHDGWAADQTGESCTDAQQVLNHIIGKLGGGIFPVGGAAEETGSHKGYGLGLIVELFTSILGGGTTSPHVKRSGNSDTTFFFTAIDYGLFGDKTIIKKRMSELLEELRQSPKAEGRTRIYTHGEKEQESLLQKKQSGIPINDKTLSEMRMIGETLAIEPTIYNLQGQQKEV